jgi:hypothetical protein
MDEHQLGDGQQRKWEQRSPPIESRLWGKEVRARSWQSYPKPDPAAVGLAHGRGELRTVRFEFTCLTMVSRKGVTCG